MFETDVEAEIPIPAIFGRDDARSFRFFSTREQRYWFFVVCVPSEMIDYEGRNHFFLHDFSEVLAIHDNPTAEILQIYIGSPPSMNDTPDWNMDLIQKVVVKTNPSEEDGEQILVFETQNGTQLTDLKKDQTTEGMRSTVIFEHT